MYSTSVKYANLMEPHSLVDSNIAIPTLNGTAVFKSDRNNPSETLIVRNSGVMYSTKY